LAKIAELDPHVADLIAAGEVVERPASVIKELMENAIDAGASSMTVEIKNGGMSYMRVTDDGCGIAPEDVRAAFLRHATSKLRDERGLEAIGTLGFRGEALAAIASVSRVDIMTRERGASEGAALTLEAGEATREAPAGCPEGTTIIVRDLFFNTPARLKFMKTDRAEGANVSAAVIACALGHPEVSVKYIKDGKEECHTPGDNRADSCVYTLFERDFSDSLISCRSSGEGVEVSGFISEPSAARGNRGRQYFFVNGRCVKSKMLQTALEQAYRNSMFTGRFPACALYIKLGAHLVDVNVHPAKTEVKFLYEKHVFDGVHYAARSALERGAAGVGPVISASTRGVINGGPEAPPRAAESARRADGGFFRAVKAEDYAKAAGGRRFEVQGREGHSVVAESFGGADGAERISDEADEGAGPETGADSLPRRQAVERRSDGAPAAIPPEEIPDMPRGAEYRVIGEALNTYIIAERGSSLWLIDKHAAHERVHFDRLKTEDGAFMSQTLIAPLVCECDARDAALLAENAELLTSLGFETDSFGETSVAIRAIPSDIDVGDAAAALEEICAQLRRGGADGAGRRDAALRAVACKAAVKAGRSHDMRELEALAGRVFSGEIRYCPHGRPVAAEFSRSALDREFKRK
jgi:DNA mismatch repair protein MutL